MAEAAVDGLMTPLERVVGSLPLCSSPLGRAAVFASLGGSFAYVVRPTMSFLPDGRPREWILVDRSNPEATLFPYWGYILVPAVLFGVFV